MTVSQTRNGAINFVRVVPDPGVGVSSVLHLKDGVSVQPDAIGGFHVRSIDLPGLQAVGLNVGVGMAGQSSMAQFQAGVLTGQGAGTAT